MLSSSENDRGTITRTYAGDGTRLRAPVQKIESTIIDGEIYMLDFYLPPNAVKEAEEMSRRYKKVKTILQEISRLNYEALKERHLTKGR